MVTCYIYWCLQNVQYLNWKLSNKFGRKKKFIISFYENMRWKNKSLFFLLSHQNHILLKQQLNDLLLKGYFFSIQIIFTNVNYKIIFGWLIFWEGFLYLNYFETKKICLTCFNNKFRGVFHLKFIFVECCYKEKKFNWKALLFSWKVYFG